MNLKIKRFRTQFLIYPQFQLKFIFINSLVMLAAFGFVGLQFYRSFQNLMMVGYKSGLDSSNPYFRFLKFEQNHLLSYLVIGFAAGFVLSSLTALVLSQKLAGPIVRLTGYFRNWTQSSDLPELSFRKGDFFSELPPLINKALSKIPPRR